MFTKATSRAFIATLVLFASSAVGAATYTIVSREVVLSRLKSAPDSNPDRESRLKEMFSEVSCEATEQPVKSARQPNVLCVLPGKSDTVIVVGAHLDKVPAGHGIIDDWSGAALLPSLYRSLATSPRNHTYVFIGFTDEERGLVGSEFYVHALSPELRKNIAAMVNLECLGLGDTRVWASHSEKILLNTLIGVAQQLKMPLSGVNVEKVGSADSESFARYQIPRITIHSLTQETLPLIHTDRDNLNAIHDDDYYQSYKLIAAYLVVLDSELGSAASLSGKQ